MYDWLRGLHILAVIAWMAGLLYLPRLFAYHTRAERGSQMDLTFQEMERKLLRIIMNPAMIATLVFGLALVWYDGAHRLGWGFLRAPWVHVKLLFILVLLGLHGFLSASRRKFEAGTNTRSAKFWRMMNELPFLAAIVIVLSATLKYGMR
jgi:putative membrane protein